MGKVSSSLGTCILGKVHRAEWAGVGAASGGAVPVERRGKSVATQKQRLQKAFLDVCFLLEWFVQTSFHPCLKK